MKMCYIRNWTKLMLKWSWFDSYSFEGHLNQGRFAHLFKCNLWTNAMFTFVKTSVIFLGHYNFELLSSFLLESGLNWCPWQALVPYRLPMYLIILSFVLWNLVWTLVWFKFHACFLNWPSVSPCNLPMKVAGASWLTNRIKGHANMRQFKWFIFTWHMLAWAILYKVWFYVICYHLQPRHKCVCQFSNKQYFAAFGSNLSLAIVIIIQWCWWWAS